MKFQHCAGDRHPEKRYYAEIILKTSLDAQFDNSD